VSAVATEGGWLETPIPESIVPELVQLPGVRTTEMFRILPGHMYRGERIAVAGGTDGNFEPARYPARWYREGDPLAAAAALRAGTGVNVSTGLADRFNLRVGDTIELDTPTGALTLPIVGVVRDYMSDRGSVIMNRRVLVDRWRETAVSRINVFLEPGASLEEVRSAIATRFHDRYRLKILSLNELLTYMGSKINRAFAFTNAIQLLVAIVTVAGIFDLLLAAILERRRELAVWRLIGADERSVRRSVVLESATVGGIGIALGLAVGMVTAWLWVAINFRYLLGYYLDYHVDGRAILWYATLVLAMTMLAGYAAASRANRQSVLEGIQKD
jgi:putative ABC transport system permease protein